MINQYNNKDFTYKDSGFDIFNPNKKKDIVIHGNDDVLTRRKKIIIDKINLMVRNERPAEVDRKLKNISEILNNKSEF